MSLAAEHGSTWGGSFVGPGMDRILALAKAVGLPHFRATTRAMMSLSSRAKRSESPAGTFCAPGGRHGRTRAAFRKDRRVRQAVPVEEPGRAPLAAEWDSQTVATWMQDNIKSALARFVMRAGILGYFAVDPQDMFVSYTCSSSSALAEASRSCISPGSPSRFDGGAQFVSDRVAQQLGGR